jgi:hypothetical protein
MGNRFTQGKRAISECDRCGFRFKLKDLKELVIKTKKVNILVCNECWEQDHPQLLLGMYPVDDPQALRNPRPDRSYVTSGLLVTNYLGEGSRAIFWGWNPVGGSRLFTAELTPNPLVAVGSIGTVTVSTT